MIFDGREVRSSVAFLFTLARKQIKKTLMFNVDDSFVFGTTTSFHRFVSGHDYNIDAVVDPFHKCAYLSKHLTIMMGPKCACIQHKGLGKKSGSVA